MAGSGVFPKTATLDVIYQGDYNLIQTTIAGVLSTYYGQTLLSSQLALLPVIAAPEWDNLRQDINKCYKHITNADSTILDVDPQDIILAGDANAYKVAADYCETNKATVAAGQLTSNVNTNSSSATWNGIRIFKVTYSWTGADAANYWFNLGGSFVVGIDGSNGSGSAKDNMWLTIINSMPDQTYSNTQWDAGSSIDLISYGTSGGVYSENYARIQIQKISATQLDVTVTLNDADTGDQQNASPTPGLPVDENVEVDVSSSITRYSSFDSIVAPAVTVTPVSNF
jgi:hypothetical protein